MSARAFLGLPPKAVQQPCSACPWRTENHGKPHPDGWYTKRNRERLWSGLRRGENMTCHPTDPKNLDPDAPRGEETRVCAGSLVLVQRELQRIVSRFDGNVSAYQAAHPRGLTRGGIAAHTTSLMFGGSTPDLLAEVAHHDLEIEGWMP